MGFVWWIIVGLIAGWATGKIMRGEGYGTFVDIIVGIAARGGMIYTILVAIGGAVILTWIIRLISGNRGSGSGGLRRAA